jgi:hypothetical protein
MIEKIALTAPREAKKPRVFHDSSDDGWCEDSLSLSLSLKISIRLQIAAARERFFSHCEKGE